MFRNRQQTRYFGRELIASAARILPLNARAGATATF